MDVTSLAQRMVQKEFGNLDKISYSAAKRQDDKESTVPDESFYYIPFSTHGFVLSMDKILSSGMFPPFKVKFLDLGCGPGVTLYLMKEVLDIEKVSGIEIDDVVAKIGVSKKLNIHVADFFNEKDFIQEHNLLYTYMPIRNGRRMAEFSVFLENTMSEETLWTEMLPQYEGASKFKYKKKGGEIIKAKSLVELWGILHKKPVFEDYQMFKVNGKYLNVKECYVKFSEIRYGVPQYQVIMNGQEEHYLSSEQMSTMGMEVLKGRKRNSY